MQYRLYSTLTCIIALSLYPATRDPNHEYIKQISQKRRNKGIDTTTVAAICTARNTSENNIATINSITIPSEGKINGTGTGFSYIADAKNGTVIISFETMHNPVITATAHDLEKNLNVIITSQSETTVMLHIENFTPGNPTVVVFSVTQSE